MANSVAYLSRTCKIAKKGDVPEDFHLTFFYPTREEHGEFVARARLLCSHFDIPVGAVGKDDVQAFLSLFTTSLARIRRLDRDEGFDVYWVEPGDLYIQDFWTYQP